MAKLLLGKEVVDALHEDLTARIAALQVRGITPTLAIVRIGENASDLSYERSAEKRAALLGIAVEKTLLPETVCKQAVLAALDKLNADTHIHGVLLFRPLPKHLKQDEDEICNRLVPQKDVDGMTALSDAGVFEGRASRGFAPCTPAACMEILAHYGIDCTGKHAVVIGRSLVVGKPVAMLLLGKNATVTICHTKTENLAALCRGADILVSAAGALGSLTEDFVSPGQVVLDVSVSWDAKKPNSKGGFGAIAGDAVFAAVEPIVGAITPVPGGIGGVTATVLMKHVIEAAERL